MGTNKTLRLLLVEDDPRDAALCIDCLTLAGYDVRHRVVTSSEEFLGCLQTETFDLVIAGYRLPGWSGMDALTLLRTGRHEIPFILMSAAIDEDVAVDCVRQGANDYLLKDRLARLPLAVERALDERQSEKTRHLLSSIVDSSEDAIIGVSSDGRILTWNLGARSIFGYSGESMRGESIERLIPEHCAGVLRDALAAVHRGDPVDRFETQGIGDRNRPLEIAVAVSPLAAVNGERHAASVIIRNITDTKSRQKELFHTQKMEVVGRFAAGVAHDFNNLLTIVNGYTSLIVSELSETNPLQAELNEICIAGERAASLTRQLLAFSNRQTGQRRVLDLNRVVTGIESLLRRLIGEDVELVTAVDPGLGNVLSDPSQIEQVVMNLAVNARDAMPKGGCLTIATANLDVLEPLRGQHAQVSCGSYVTLTVSDTGVGMTQATQERMFEPFFTTKRLGEGTGLGLSTVYGIVAQSGGAILVDSEVGRGASFRIFLPRVYAEVTEPGETTSASQPRGSETILLVEDEYSVRDLIASILRKRGYHVIVASNGAEALSSALQHPGAIDLLITDVVMPRLTGGELAVRLVTIHPETKVLFISGYSPEEIVRRADIQPGSPFLEKPFPPPSLICKVREVLDARPAH